MINFSTRRVLTYGSVVAPISVTLEYHMSVCTLVSACLSMTLTGVWINDVQVAISVYFIVPYFTDVSMHMIG